MLLGQDGSFYDSPSSLGANWSSPRDLYASKELENVFPKETAGGEGEGQGPEETKVSIHSLLLL